MKYFLLLIIVITIGCGATVDEDVAIQALNDAGYSKVQVLDKNFVTPAWSGCGENDSVAFKCSAINPSGKKVKLTVCSGWLFKSATIRH